MGNNLAVVSPVFKRTDTVEQSPTGRPELDFLNESKKGYLLAIVYFLGSLLCHSCYYRSCLKRHWSELARSPGVTPGYADLESALILPIYPPENH